MGNIIKQVSVNDQLYDIVALSANTAASAACATNAVNAEVAEYLGDEISAISSASTSGTAYKGLKLTNSSNSAVIGLNSKGNLSLLTTPANGNKGHINIEPTKNIQIKPGNNFIFDTTNRMLLSDKNRVDIRCEFGDYQDYVDQKAPYGIGSPSRAALANAEGNDEHWAECVFNARNIDLRCNDHGGVAIQPCGKDGDGNENKIKFESSRAAEIGASVVEYSKEGGKGLEFGTFNNLHTSLYTGDYRFKGNAKVYGVTRDTPILDPAGDGHTDKFDYPTQADDFKDILPINESGQTVGATWNEIINVARNYADGKISAGSGEGGSASVDPEIWASKSWVNEQGFLKEIELPVNVTNAVLDTNFLKARVFRKEKNGNLEITAENLYKYEVDNDPTTELVPIASAAAVYYASVEEYNADKGTELDAEAFALLTDEEKIKTPAVEAYAGDPASLDLVSEGKIAIKGTEISLEAGAFAIPVEISKKGKFTIGGIEIEGKIKTMADVAAGLTQCPTAFNLVMDKNNIMDFADATEKEEIAVAYPVGSIVGSVTIGELIGLKTRVAELEAELETRTTAFDNAVQALEDRIAALEAFHSEPEGE